MKYLKVLMLVVLVCCAARLSAKVDIQYAGNTIVYDNNPRLSTVLSRLVLGKEFYWHNASLYQKDDTGIQQLVSGLNDLLNSEMANTGIKTQKMQALLRIREQVSQWQIAKRLPLDIDYDLVRIREELNPRLDDGSYVLHLPFRVYDVHVIGAIKEDKTIPHMATKDVSAYIDSGNFEFLPYADSSLVYIIHPDGHINKVSLGFHYSGHNEVPPGGTLFIPLKELPFSNGNTEINELVAQLAGSRLP